MVILPWQGRLTLRDQLSQEGFFDSRRTLFPPQIHNEIKDALLQNETGSGTERREPTAPPAHQDGSNNRLIPLQSPG